MYFLVYDDSGAPIRRVDGSTDAGFQRVAWDLRLAAPKIAEHHEDSEENFRDATEQGPLVVPGTYSVRMFEKVGGAVSEVSVPQTFRVTTEQSASMSAADQAVQEEFLRKVSRLYRAVYGANRMAENAQERLKQIHESLREIPAVEKQLGSVADGLEQRDRDILRALRGDIEIARRNEPVPSSIGERVDTIIEGERFSMAKPTQSDMDSYGIAAGEFAEQLAKLRSLVEVDLAKLEKDMESAGAPWTPGRVPEWTEK